MELCPCQATTRPSTQELPNIIQNQKFHYRIHNIPPLITILNQINTLHTIPSYLPSHLRLDLPSGLCPSDVPIKTPVCISPLPMRVTCTAHNHCHCIDHYKYIWWRVDRYSACLRARRPRVRSSSPGGGKNVHFSMSSRPALGSTQPPIQCVPRVKWPGREADESPATGSEAEKKWVYTSTPPYVFVA
jgi:hypothetical protein